MAELMNGDTLIVVAVAGEVKQVLLTEAGHRQAAGAAHPLVLVCRVRAVPVLGHVRVELVLTDNDQARAALHHRLDDVAPAGKQVADDVPRTYQRQVGDLGRGQNRDPLYLEELGVESPRRVPVTLPEAGEDRLGRFGHRRRLLDRAVGSGGVPRLSATGLRENTPELTGMPSSGTTRQSRPIPLRADLR